MKRVLRWVLPLLLACDDSESASSAPPATRNSAVLCDGSEAVRLAIMNNGGEVDTAHPFTHPYGWTYLFVTGRCTFISQPEASAARDLATGTFSQEQADTLSRSLKLAELSGKTYRARSFCSDAPVTQVITADGYAEGACGDQPPALIADVLSGVSPALELARSVGQPPRGAIEVVAIADYLGSKSPPAAAIAWPFSWPITEAAVPWTTTRGAHGLLARVRTLTGADAELARELRSRAWAMPVYSGHLDITAGETSYALFLRDAIDPALQASIASFRGDNDLHLPRPIALCSPERVLDDVRLDEASLQGTTLHVSTDEDLPCGAELCWDGSFAEEVPVGAAVRIARPEQPRSCLGPRPAIIRDADLQPLIDAFRRGYPKQSVTIALGLVGAPPFVNTLSDPEGEDKLCAALTTEACAADERCRVISGAPLDLTVRCQRPTMPLGCQAASKGCDAAIKQGTAPDGTAVMFPSGCLPADYVAWTNEPTAALPACAP
jgi:hypothetical protein